LCMALAMTTPLLPLRNIGNNFQEDKFQTDVCLVMFTNICKK
jgi:hypothetical protein